MWDEFFVGSLLAPRGFSPGTSVSPFPSKTNIFKFQFDLECMLTYKRIPEGS